MQIEEFLEESADLLQWMDEADAEGRLGSCKLKVKLMSNLGYNSY